MTIPKKKQNKTAEGGKAISVEERMVQNPLKGSKLIIPKKAKRKTQKRLQGKKNTKKESLKKAKKRPRIKAQNWPKQVQIKRKKKSRKKHKFALCRSKKYKKKKFEEKTQNWPKVLKSTKKKVRKEKNGPCRSRTCDLRVISTTL